MLPSAEVHIETMELHAVESSDSECENTDDEFERHAGHAAGSEDSTDEGDTGDEEDSGPFQAPNGVNFELAYGLSIAHTFSTGWEIGVLKGQETKNKGHKGEYIVKYPSEKAPYQLAQLGPREYGAGEYWVLLTIDKQIPYITVHAQKRTRGAAEGTCFGTFLR